MNSLRIPDHGIAKLAATGDEHAGQARDPPCGMDEPVVDPAHTALRVRDGSRTTAARGRCAQKQHERALSRAKSVGGSATGATAHARWFRRARCGRIAAQRPGANKKTNASVCVRSAYLAPRWLATFAALRAWFLPIPCKTGYSGRAASRRRKARRTSSSGAESAAAVPKPIAATAPGIVGCACGKVLRSDSCR